MLYELINNLNRFKSGLVEVLQLPLNIQFLWPTMVLVFPIPAAAIGMRKHKNKVIFTILDHLLPLTQGNTMSD